MVMLRHPVTKAEYLRRDDGLIQVTGLDGVSGIFDRNGRWIEGKRRSADPALCLWVASAKDSTRSPTIVSAPTEKTAERSPESNGRNNR